MPSVRLVRGGARRGAEGDEGRELLDRGAAQRAGHERLPDRAGQHPPEHGPPGGVLDRIALVGADPDGRGHRRGVADHPGVLVLPVQRRVLHGAGLAGDRPACGGDPAGGRHIDHRLGDVAGDRLRHGLLPGRRAVVVDAPGRRPPSPSTPGKASRRIPSAANVANADAMSIGRTSLSPSAMPAVGVGSSSDGIPAWCAASTTRCGPGVDAHLVEDGVDRLGHRLLHRARVAAVRPRSCSPGRPGSSAATTRRRCCRARRPGGSPAAPPTARTA